MIVWLSINSAKILKIAIKMELRGLQTSSILFMRSLKKR